MAECGTSPPTSPGETPPTPSWLWIGTPTRPISRSPAGTCCCCCSTCTVQKEGVIHADVVQCFPALLMGFSGTSRTAILDPA